MNHLTRIQSGSASTVRHAAQVQTLPYPHTAIRRLNISLVIAMLVLLGYYVVQVNMLAALTWNIGDANDRLTALRDARNGLVATEDGLDNRQALTDRAQQEGLVPAGSVVYLVQDHAVAAVR